MKHYVVNTTACADRMPIAPITLKSDDTNTTGSQDKH